MIQPSMKGTSSNSSEKNFSCIEENTKPELVGLDNMKNESTHDITNFEENNIVNPSKFSFSTMHTKEMYMKLTISCDAITQATSPYVPSISSTSSIHPTRDPLQIPTTSLSFDESISGSEILTFATNYNASSSSDTRSVLVNTVNRYDPPSILNRVPQLSNEETFDQERSNLPTVGSYSINQASQFRSTWGFRKSLCCFLPINDEAIETLPHSSGAPPAYSSIYTRPLAAPRAESSAVIDDRRYYFPSINNSSFVARTPPPSYAQAQGVQFDSYSVEQNMSTSRKCLENILYLQQTLSVLSDASNSSWPPRSIATICPRCIALIVTTTEIRRSTITHLSAFLLCLCGCWPCCMIPYCLDSCKSIDHYCPVCRTYLGTYTPW